MIHLPGDCVFTVSRTFFMTPEPFFDKTLKRVLFFLFGFITFGMPLSMLLGRVHRDQKEAEWILEGIQKLPGLVLEYRNIQKKWPESLQDISAEKTPVLGFNFKPASISGYGEPELKKLPDDGLKLVIAYDSTCSLYFDFSKGEWTGTSGCNQKDAILSRIPVHWRE